MNVFCDRACDPNSRTTPWIILASSCCALGIGAISAATTVVFTHKPICEAITPNNCAPGSTDAIAAQVAYSPCWRCGGCCKWSYN